ncbi:hypothetical protein ACVWWJ_000420 [Luteibacter sp. HA06]
MRSLTEAEEKAVLGVAALNLESIALGEAALLGDLNEARFRASLLATQATELGFDVIGVAAADVCVALGPVDSEPAPGYGAAMFRLGVLMDPSR